MRIAIMQPYIFPYIGYFQLIRSVDVFVVYDDVNYINKGWINRNNILVAGKPSMFTIPLSQASQNRLIKDIDLLNDSKWKVKFLKTIQASYVKAPLFNEVFPIVQLIVNSEETNLSKFISNSLKEINQYLNIQTEIRITSAQYSNISLKAQNRILDICLKEGAKTYINPIGGLELYSTEEFSKHNIQLQFVKSKPVQYQQFSNEFVPWLSIIDILMFNSREKIYEFLNQYELIDGR